MDNVIACGHKSGLVSFLSLESDGERPGFDKLAILSTSPEHKDEVTGVVWNERYGRLITTDAVGFLVIWYQREGKWTIWNLGERTGFKITSLACSDNGELVSLGYENGLIVVGSSEVETRWTAKLDYGVISASWVSDMKVLFVATQQGHLFSISCQGEKVKEIECPVAVRGHGIRRVVTNRKGDSLVAFDNCLFVLMKAGDDADVIDAGIDITAIAWNRNGEMFAVAGRSLESVSVTQIRFYDASGRLIRTYSLQTSGISSLYFDGTGMKVVVGVGSSICVLTILSLRPYHFFKDTLVYSAPRVRSSLSDVVFFNTKTSTKRIREIDSLGGIVGTEYIVVLSSVSATGQSTLLVLDEFGIPQASISCEFTVTHVTIDSSYVCAASSKQMLLWDYKKDEAQKRTFSRSVAALAARNNLLFVAFSSCELMCYSLPSLNERSRYNLPFIAVTISLSLDATRLSLVDVDGEMSFLDVHSGTVSLKEDARSETWCVRWAVDHSDYFASVERQRIYLYHGFSPYESLNSMTNICQLKDLVLTTVDFGKLLSDPLHPKLDYFHAYETKPLRDMRKLLESNVAKDELLSYVESMDHPVLWKMIGHFYLASFDSANASKALKRTRNPQSDMFVDFLARFQKDTSIQKGLILWYLGMYDKAETLFARIGRSDLLVKMLTSTGQWLRVLQLAEPASQCAKQAHVALAKQSEESMDFSQAAEHYGLAGDVRQQIRCLFKAQKFDQLCSLMTSINPDSHSEMINDIGNMFKSIGCASRAVEAFILLHDYQSATDTCLALKDWNLAMHLLKTYKEVDRTRILAEFTMYLMRNGHLSAALKVLERHKMDAELSKILEVEGDNAYRSKRFVQAKKCYVFGALHNPSLWHKAEAVHFLIVAHQLVYSERYTEAVEVCCRLQSVYSDVLGIEIPAALCAIVGLNAHYFRLCSRGFTLLEHSKRIGHRKGQKIRDLAIRVFAKVEPSDPDDIHSLNCPECGQEIRPPEAQCRCGYVTTPSTLTGGAMWDGKCWKCPRCSHYLLQREAQNLKFCPLCHFVMK